MDDVISKLLQTTGLSCDDLLSKLQEYKKVKEKTESEVETNGEDNSNLSVIVETQSSTPNNNVNSVEVINVSEDAENINEESASLQHKEEKNDVIETKSCVNESSDDKSADEAKRAAPPEEKLRDIIRQLRNAKKSNNYFTDIDTKKVMIELPVVQIKKKRKSAELNCINSIDEPHANETGFVILNVTGGVDLINNDKPDNATSAENVEKSPKQAISIKKDIVSPDFNNKENSIKQQWPKKSEKSPFVSDTLDNFLNDNAKLKISYDLPKLGAEEGLSEDKKKEEFDAFFRNKPEENNFVQPKKAPKMIKAKTLAEMRRQFEKFSKSKQSIVAKKQEEAVKIQPTVLAVGEKVEEIAKSDKEASKSQAKPVENKPKLRNSYVMFNERKLHVLSQKENECLANIKPIETKIINYAVSKPLAPRRPSLLTYYQPKLTPVKYAPGPLAEKIRLQDKQTLNEWSSHLKKLPSVHLELTPQANKPFPPAVINRLPIFTTQVISSEHANFAASAVQQKNATQTSLKTFTFPVRYQNDQQLILVRKRRQYPLQTSHTQTLEDIDPEKQVENVVNNLLNYVEVKQIEDSLIKDDTESRDNETAKQDKPKNGRPKNVDRLQMELNRLSCKIIDVTTTAKCTKAFCKLGCICNSLNSLKFYADHCQQSQCMFECKCPPVKEKEILTLTNSLSSSSATHLDQNVKQNLARVERDFTQTLIKTNDDVILIGSERNKTRRASKRHSILKQRQVKNCRVDVEQLNLSAIVPYCMQHGKHKCFCNYRANLPKVVQKKPTSNEEEVRKIVVDLGCARTRQVHNEYKQRNSHDVYKDLLKKRMRQFIDTNVKPPCNSVVESELEVVSPPSTPQNGHKRKQSFDVLRDEPATESRLQRRKKKQKTDEPNEPYVPRFEGAHRVALASNPDLLKHVRNDNGSKYIFLLPWKTLMERYESKKIFVWSQNVPNGHILCNTKNRKPPKNYFDISRVKHKSELINWIMDGPPGHVDVAKLSLVLLPKKENFQIVGHSVKSATQVESKPEKVAWTFDEILKLLGERSMCVYNHRDMQNVNHHLYLTKCDCKKRTVYAETKKSAEVPSMTVALPPLPKDYRWLMVRFNRNCAYLYFKALGYSIKYETLDEISRIAKKLDATIRIGTKIISSLYTHRLFGIVLTSTYSDRLFIGPLSIGEEHCVERLCLAQDGQLSCSKDASAFQFVYELPQRTLLDLPKGLEIKVVNKDEGVVKEKERDLEIIPVNSRYMKNLRETILEESLLCPPFIEYLNESELKMKKANRFLFTNIPKFGYLEGYQSDNKTIDVYIPTGNKGFRFPNVTFAKKSLIQLLYQIFVPVPLDFKINVLISTHLNMESNRPALKKYFEDQSDTFICGEFGICTEKEFPKPLVQRYKIDTISEYKTRSELYVDHLDRMIRLFGMFLMSNEELKKNSRYKEILNWAVCEIYMLEQEDVKSVLEKERLLSMLAKKQSQVKKLEKPEKKHIPNLKCIILQKEGTENNEVETIELLSDSDDEVKPPPLKIIKHKPMQLAAPSIFKKNIQIPRKHHRSLLKKKISVINCIPIKETVVIE